MKQSITILNIPIHKVTRRQARDTFIDLAKGKSQSTVATPNAEILLETQKNSKLTKFLQHTDLNVADSVSLLWAGAYVENNWSKFRAVLELLFLPIRKKHWKNTFPETVTGSDLYLEICKKAEKERLKIYCLGGSEKVSEKNKNFIQEKFPKLKISAHSGDGRPKGDKENIEKINEAKPDILFIAYGCPKQELWIERNLKKCASVRVAIGIGGTFDFYAGKLKRAPKWMQRLGLEWLWRLILQPTRIKRIWNAVVVFPLQVLKG